MSDYATKLTPYSMLVIDGGTLLNFMRWEKNATRMQTCWDSTVPFSGQSMDCAVVFDGYEEQSTTCHEHNRRQTGNVSAAIIVIAEKAETQRSTCILFK